MNFNLKNKKVFVAGHAGLVGQSLCKRLEKENCKILYINKKSLDLRDFNKTDKWLKLNKPDYIFIAAARVGGILENTSFPADFIYDNLSIATNLIHLSHKNNIKKVLYLGSSCIYPKFAKQPINEQSLLTGPLEPTNEWYAIAKIAGLKLCKAYALQHKRNFISAMPTNLYGPGDNFDVKSGHVLPSLINKVHYAVKHNKKNVIIWGTGKPRREFLYIDDCADACIFLIENLNAEELYGWDVSQINIGSGKDISISELATIIAKVAGYEKSIIFDSSMPDGVPRKMLDVSRINKLGWKSSTSLFKGISKTYEWYVKEK